MIPNQQKPYGHLGTLYERVSTFSAEPVKEIEGLAKQALEKEVINIRDYVVLMYRLPFSGVERETLESIGNRLGRSRENIRQREAKSCRRLQKYILNKEMIENSTVDELMQLSIDSLIWSSDRTSTLAHNALKRQYGYNVTIGMVVEEVRKRISAGRHFYISWFRPEIDKAMYKAFDRSGIKLLRV